jgi:hypothetical protein
MRPGGHGIYIFLSLDEKGRRLSMVLGNGELGVDRAGTTHMRGTP